MSSEDPEISWRSDDDDTGGPSSRFLGFSKEGLHHPLPEIVFLSCYFYVAFLLTTLWRRPGLVTGTVACIVYRELWILVAISLDCAWSIYHIYRAEERTSLWILLKTEESHITRSLRVQRDFFDDFDHPLFNSYLWFAHDTYPIFLYGDNTWRIRGRSLLAAWLALFSRDLLLLDLRYSARSLRNRLYRFQRKRRWAGWEPRSIAEWDRKVLRNIISGHNERLGIRTGANAAASTAIRYWIDLEGFVLYKGLQSLLKASRESGFKLENSFDGEDFFILFFLSWKLWGADLCSVVTFTPQILRALLRIGRWNPLEELHSAARALQIQTAVSLARQCLISWPLQSFLAIRRGIRDFSSSPFKTALLRLLRPRVAPDTTRITWFCPCCQKELYGDFSNRWLDKIENLTRSLNPTNDAGSGPPPPSPPSASHQQGSGASTTSFPSSSSSSSNTSSSNQASERQLARSRKKGKRSHFRTLVGYDRSYRLRFLELCINTGTFRSPGEVNLMRGSNDASLFHDIRRCYRAVRGFRATKHFLLRPVEIRYVHFVLERATDKMHIFKSPSYPPAECIAKSTWACHAEPPPPMPSESFIHYLDGCRKDLSKLSQSNTWLGRLPKKLDCSIFASREPLSEAWGIHIVEGLDWAKILWIVFTLLFGVAVPTTVYVAVKTDLATTAGVASLFVAILTLLFMMATVQQWKQE